MCGVLHPALVEVHCAPATPSSVERHSEPAVSVALARCDCGMGDSRAALGEPAGALSVQMPVPCRDHAALTNSSCTVAHLIRLLWVYLVVCQTCLYEGC
jgi:hypothetical protein